MLNHLLKPLARTPPAAGIPTHAQLPREPRAHARRHHGHAGVGLEGLARVGDGASRRGVQAVELLGAIDRDDADGITLLGQDGGHGNGSGGGEGGGIKEVVELEILLLGYHPLKILLL